MAEEFKKIAGQTASSIDGFTVELRGRYGVMYRDGSGETRIFYELLVNPSRILLYTTGFGSMEKLRIDAMLSNAKRALEYLGNQVEIDSPPRIDAMLANAKKALEYLGDQGEVDSPL
jgi:hypothetical protein